MDNEEWFRGKDVCEISGFKNINDTLLKGVKKAYKTDVKSLVELTSWIMPTQPPIMKAKQSTFALLSRQVIWACIVQACVCITIRNSWSFFGFGLRRSAPFYLKNRWLWASGAEKRNDARGSSACRRTQQGHDLTRSSQKRVQDCLKIHRTICKTLSCRPQYQQRGQSCGRMK